MKHDHLLKRGSWIDRLLLGSIITLAAIIAFFTVISGDSKFQITTAAATNHSDSTTNVTKIDSDFPDIQMIKETSDDKSMSYTLLYPQTRFEAVNKVISKYITDSKERYSNAIEQNDANTPGELRISTGIYEYKNQYYSIVLTNKSSVDRVKFEAEMKTFFFDHQSGKLITSRNLLNEDLHYLDLFSKYIRSRLLGNKNYIKENVILSTKPYWKNFERFAIIKDHLVLYYNKGEIAPRTISSPTLFIPLSYVNPILAKELVSSTKSNNTIISPKGSLDSVHKKRVALTFDDGPHPTITKQILNILDKYDARATFFMVGYRAEKNPSIVKEVWSRGNEIGNHSWSHPQLTELSSKDVLTQFNSTNKVIQNATGKPATVFRPPYGDTNKRVKDLISVPQVLWSIDTLDWKYRNADTLLPMVKKNMHNNAIILMHDVHQSTADGLEQVLAYLQKEGYEFVTVSDILPYR